MTTLWLSPTLKNCQYDNDAYHGYGIQNFLAAEPRYADDREQADDELRALVDAAHAHGMYVIFDIVFHHTRATCSLTRWRSKSGEAVARG